MRRTLTTLGLIVLTVYFGDSAPVVGQQPGTQTRKPAAKRQQGSITFQQYAQRHDVDKDGKITRDEFKGNPQFFNQRDGNGDGVITEAEFTAAVGRGRPQQSGGRKVPEGVKAFRDLEYAEVDGQSLKLDLFVPEDTKAKPPLLVWIHGGGWFQGNKSQFNPMFLRLTAEGYAAASIDYRLEFLKSHPKQIHDCKGAIRWLRSQAGKYGYDATRIAVGGGSAGGHLSLLLGMSTGIKELEGDVGGNLDQSSRVHAIVDLFGPSALDLFAEESPKFARNKTPELLKSASPLTYLDEHDPPLIIFYGDHDKVVPPSQNEVLHKRYQEVGLESSLHLIKGAAHGGMQFSDAERYGLVKAFVDRHIKQTDGAVNKEPSKPGAPPKIPPASNKTRPTATGAKSIPAGIYYTGNAGMLKPEHARYDEIPEIDLPYIAGISFRQAWRNLEPEEDQYDWTPLENAYDLATSRNKWLMITVTGGMGTPEWVYDKGARSVTFSSDEIGWMGRTGGKQFKMVVTWDDIYLKEFFDFLKALGKKIEDWNYVYCIHVTGGGFISEMHLPKHLPETLKQWEEAGISNDVMLDTWKEIIGAYDKTMPPHVGLSVALSPVLKKVNVEDEFSEWAVERYGNRVWFQRNILKERTARTNGRYSQRIRDLSSKTTVGWQTAIAPGKDFGDDTVAYKHAVETGACFVESYPREFKEEAYHALTELSKGLQDNYNNMKHKYLGLHE